MLEAVKNIITAIIIATLIYVALELFVTSVDYIGAAIGLTSGSDMVLLAQIVFYLLFGLGMFILDRFSRRPTK